MHRKVRNTYKILARKHRYIWKNNRSGTVVTGYELDGWGSIPGRGKRFLSFSQCSDWLWVSPSFLLNGYLGLFPSGKAAGA